MKKRQLKFWDRSLIRYYKKNLGIIGCKKKSRQFDLVKLVGVRGEDAERRPPAQMVPISKCITTQTKYIRSEISHKNTKILTQIQTKYIRSEISLTNTRKYLNKCKKYPHTNTDQVLSVGNVSHKYRQSIFGQKCHKYKPSQLRIRYRIQI